MLFERFQQAQDGYETDTKICAVSIAVMGGIEHYPFLQVG